MLPLGLLSRYNFSPMIQKSMPLYEGFMSCFISWCNCLLAVASLSHERLQVIFDIMMVEHTALFSKNLIIHELPGQVNISKLIYLSRKLAKSVLLLM